MSYLTTRTSAAQLDGQWDALCDSLFQRRSFLEHCERYNPCGQRYHLLMEGNTLLAGAIVYTRPLDLLTYLGIPSPIRMHIAGVPASVSSGGFIGRPRHLAALARELPFVEKGFLLYLNTASPLDVEGMVWGPTLPTILYIEPFGSVDEYEANLRADYRRRFRRIAARFEGVVREILPMSAFSEEMYRGYEAVWQRSDAKLEKLSEAFFRNLPTPFSLTTFSLEGHLIGWHVTVQDSDRAVFFMGGLDYAVLEDHETYFNMTFDILAQSMEHGLTSIDLGQTAEVPKTRLGGRVEPRFMGARLSNPVLNLILSSVGRFLAYRRDIPEHRVFRTTGDKREIQ